MVAPVLSELLGYFKLNDINIDNVVFKLFYVVSFIICLAGSAVSIMSQYFGKPISCEFTSIDKDQASDYCWIHGSAYIDKRYEGLGCYAGKYMEESDDKGGYVAETGYYQWVTFVFAIQAGIFYLPYKLWVYLEGGLIEAFGSDAKTPVIVSEEDGEDIDAVMMKVLTQKFILYFKSTFHHNTWYFGYFVFCELLNFFFLIIQIMLTNTFLNNKFRWYGWKVIEWYSHTYEERKHGAIENPMCSVFPTEVSCTIPNVGTDGKIQYHNGMCVLTQNVINEKMYLVLWFWYAFMVPICIMFFFYRLITIFYDRLRYALISVKIQRWSFWEAMQFSYKHDTEIEKSLEYVLDKCQIGDWFVLYQLSKNTNPYFYREFIRELALHLKQKPKKTSKSQGNTLPTHTTTKSSSN